MIMGVLVFTLLWYMIKDVMHIISIKDIWDSNTNNWKTGVEIYNSLVSKRNWIGEYNKIKAYIPNTWKQIISGAIVEESKNVLTNPKELSLIQNVIYIKGHVVQFEKLKEKELYFMCLYPTDPPNAVEAWSKGLNITLSIKDIFGEPFHFMYYKKSQNFHYKTLHRAIYSEMRLKQMNKSNGVCTLCKSENESTSHMLIECSIVKKVWKRVATLLNNILEHQIVLNAKHILFGYKYCEELSESEIIVCNLIIFNAKWIIWKHRNDVKYGKNKIKDCDTIFKNILLLCQENGNDILQSSIKKKCSEKTCQFLEQIVNYTL